MKIVVVDTSGLFAAIDERSQYHRAARDTLSELRRAKALLLLSPFILAEVDYLLSDRWKRPDIARQVLRDVADGRYRLEPFDSPDVARTLDIIETYSDQNIGIADASNVVLAERHDTLDVLTLDERHFRVLRGPGGMTFRLLPADRRPKTPPFSPVVQRFAKGSAFCKSRIRHSAISLQLLPLLIAEC